MSEDRHLRESSGQMAASRPGFIETEDRTSSEGEPFPIADTAQRSADPFLFSWGQAETDALRPPGLPQDIILRRLSKRQAAPFARLWHGFSPAFWQDEKTSNTRIETFAPATYIDLTALPQGHKKRFILEVVARKAAVLRMQKPFAARAYLMKLHPNSLLLVCLLPAAGNRRSWYHLENRLAKELAPFTESSSKPKGRFLNQQVLKWLAPMCLHQRISPAPENSSFPKKIPHGLSLPWMITGILSHLIRPYWEEKHHPIRLTISPDEMGHSELSFLVPASHSQRDDRSFVQFTDSLKHAAKPAPTHLYPPETHGAFLNLQIIQQKEAMLNLGEGSEKPHFSFGSGPLSLTVVDSQSDIHLDWACASESKTAHWLPVLARRFNDLLRRVIQNPLLPLNQCYLPSKWQQRRVLSRQRRDKNLQQETLVTRFFEKARVQPDGTALYFQDQVVTYRALRQRSEKVAKWLLSQGLHLEEPVVLLLQPQPDFVAAFLGILQAGGVVLALDLEHPASRLATFLSECHPRFGIHSGIHPLQKGERGLITLDLSQPIPRHTPSKVLPTPLAQNLAYLIYTSGSTGKPKAAMATHENLLTRLAWFEKRWPYESNEATIWKKSPSLIGSLPEIFSPLLGGVPLHIAPQTVRKDPFLLFHFLDSRRITRLWASPGFLTALLETMAPAQPHLQQLRKVVTSGDMISETLAQTWLERIPQAPLFNVYGSTEVASDVSFAEIRPGSETVLAIGRPFPRTRFFISRDPFQQQPLGLPGRLWISGAQLARGYWDNPRATALFFRPDAFSEKRGSRIFDTGDLALISEVGNTLLLGRDDHLVNLRGYRLAPAEIEKAITRFPSVRAAGVTLLAHASDQKLVGFLVQNSGMPLNETALRHHLKNLLPNHMIPNHFQVLKELPRTRSGKLDRRALKTIDPQFFPSRTTYQPPRNLLERQLTAIWQQVLGCSKVGIHDHFFELGGHSLLATRILTGIRLQFGFELPMVFFFRFQTIADQAGFLENLAPPTPQRTLLDQGESVVEGPLTPEQLGMWFQHQLSHHTHHLHLQKAWAIRAKHPALIMTALELLQRRHPVLRTIFMDSGMGPIFRTLDHATPSIRIIDHQRVTVVASRFPQNLPSGSQEPFDLSSPPWRSFIFLGPNQDVVLWSSFHHLIADGWSLHILESELRSLLQSLDQKTPIKLADIPYSFPRYAHWRAAREKRQPLHLLRSFWKKQLAELPGMHLFPDGPNKDTLDFRGREWRLDLPKSLHHKLQSFCRTHGVSAFHPGLAIFAQLLARRSGQHDLTVLTPFANRNDASLEQTVGMFVQTMILRLNAPRQNNFVAWVNHTRRIFNEAISHHGLAFADMLRSAGHQSSLHNHPALRIMFAYYPLPPPLSTSPEVSRTICQDLEPEYQTSQFDLSLNLAEVPAGLQLRFQYRTAVFSQPTISLIGNQFITLLEECLNLPNKSLETLIGVPPEELQREYRPRLLPKPHLVPTHLRVFEAARINPKQVACIFQNHTLSFQELVGSAQALCRLLQKQGLKPGDTVAIFATQSLELPVAWLGCMFGGYVGVPLDPTWPESRIQHFVTALKLTLALWASDQDIRNPLAMHLLNVPLTKEADFNHPPPAWSPQWSAYAMATSGSTGTPKTVVIPHDGLANRLSWMDQTFLTDAAPVVLQTTPPLFDSSMWELFWPLIHGGKTILASKEDCLSGKHVASLIERYQISVMDSVPSVFSELLFDLERSESQRFVSLKTLILGSEDFPFALMRRISKALPQVIQWNLYGPTEATIGCIAYRINGSETVRIPIGKAIQGTSALLLNAHFQPVPAGMPAQLFLAGHCLGTGYAASPRETAAAFLPHPYSLEPGARLYKTGDLVRRQADGSIVFCGRLDHQIKINGIRVEPSEIENLLISHPAISACAVISVQSPAQRKSLAAYIVLEKGHPAAQPEWEELLRKHLPDPLIPQHFRILPSLPKNAAGKLDRKALPAIQPPGTMGSAQAPRTRMEAALVRLFEEILRARPVGIQDSFFQLGGQSISAMRLIGRIRSEFHLDPPLRIIFEKPTPLLLAKTLETLKEEQNLKPAPVDQSQPLPLTFVQERLWFLSQLEPHAPYYHLRLIKTIDTVALAALEKAFHAVEQRHLLWHSAIEMTHGRPHWKISRRKSRQLRCIDLSGLSIDQQHELATGLAEKETAAPFHLTKPPLHRQLVLRRSTQQHDLIFTCHHIIADGWSMALWEHELSNFYLRELGLPVTPLPPLRFQFFDIAHWQRMRFSTAVKERLMAYWRPKLQDIKPLHLIPKLPTHFPGKGAAFEAVLDLQKPQWEQIKAQTTQTGTTPFIWILSLLKTLLFRYSHQEIICVGTPSAGRDLPEAEPLLGCFLNTLPLATHLDGNPSFRDVLMAVRETFLGGLAHQEIPFEYLIEELGLSRDLDHAPLFQVLLVWEEQTRVFPLEPGLFSETGPHDVHLSHQTKYDLTCHVHQRSDGLELAFYFAESRYPKELADSFSQQFSGLVQAVLDNPHDRIQNLPLTPCKTSWPGQIPAPPDPVFYTLPDLFRAVAEHRPQAIALAQGSFFVTYEQMDQWVTNLAARLHDLGFENETVIAFAMPRSPLSIIVMLGILRAGHTFIALDPKLPRKRRQYVLKDSRARFMVTDADAPEHSFHHGLPQIALRIQDLFPKRTSEHLKPILPDQLAYLVYTSGSTGKPKGIAMSHRAIVAYVNATNARYHLCPNDRVLQIASAAFDASYRDIFGALLAGAQLVIPFEDEAGDLFALCRYLSQWKMTIVYSGVPSFLKLLAEEAAQHGPVFSTLRLMISGGERLFWRDVAHFHKSFGDQVAVYNQYGLSETCVTVTSFPAVPGGDSNPDVPMGPPLPYAKTYLLSKNLATVPPHGMGQVYIAGPAHARCYWGKPRLTAQKIIPDPLAEVPGARLFDTGDLAYFSKMAANGLRFIGRSDHQVKIRGHRVEIAEIEASLRGHSSVAGCAVRFLETPSQRLIAYLKVTADQSHDRSTWRQYLEGNLPAVMIPDEFVILEKFPRLANKKINYAALPIPESPETAEPTTDLPTNQSTLSLLTYIWRQVLRVEHLEPSAHFFLSGGHSLLATQVVARIRKEFGLQLPLRTIFEKQTLGEQAAAIDQLRQQHASLNNQPIRLRNPIDQAILSSAQKRLWFLEELEPGRSRFHIPVALRIRGPETARMAQALAALVEKHASLRTGIQSINHEPRPFLRELDGYQPQLIDLSGLPEFLQNSVRQSLAAREARLLFQLHGGALYRHRLLQLGPRDHVLLQTYHHLIADGWSLGIIERDLRQFLSSNTERKTSDHHDPPPISYVDWAIWQYDRLQGSLLTKRLTFWKRAVSDVSALTMPQLHHLDKPTRGQGDRFGFNIPAALVQTLAQMSHLHGCTLFNALHASFEILLYRYSGQKDFCIGVPFANREATQTENIVGLFVNTLPLRAQIGGNPHFIELMTRIRNHSLEAFSHSDFPMEQLVQALGTTRNLARTPLFQVSLVFHQPIPGMRDHAADNPELDLVRLKHRPTTAKYDLSAHFEPLENGLRANFIYDLDRLSAKTIRLMAEHFLVILKLVGQQPQTPIASLPLTRPNEYHLLANLNQTDAAKPRHSLGSLFFEQATAAPDATALCHPDGLWTYGHLMTQIAGFLETLEQHSVKPGHRVALFAETSPEAVAAILACFHLGATFVPLSVDWPIPYLRRVLGDASPELILVQAESLPKGNTRFLQSLENAGFGTSVFSNNELRENPPVILTKPRALPPNIAAYLLYTSGSSGKPKGVLSSHAALANRLQSLRSSHPFEPEEVGFLKKEPIFIGFLTELLGPLIQGRPIIMPTWVERKNPQALMNLMARHRMSRLWAFPRLLASMIPLWEDSVPEFRCLKTIFSSGEILSRHLSQRLIELFPWLNLVNVYGSTELASDVAYHHVPRRQTRQPAIGLPIAHNQLWALTETGALQPPELPGELAVGGLHLAQAYWRQPGLTAERFRPDPFASQPGSRLFYTGDWVSISPKQGATLHRRMDHILKVRGYQINPQVIEARLREHPHILDAAVLGITNLNDGQDLVAFIVAARKITHAAIRHFLSENLPAYTLPTHYVFKKNLPRSQNGKLRIAALSDPKYLDQQHASVPYIHPKTEKEILIAQIWAEALGKRRIGLFDNFFDLGGHSLIAAQIRARLVKSLERDLPLSALFEYQTVAELTRFLNASAHLAPVTPVSKPSKRLVPSFAQQRWWFLQQFEQGHHYQLRRLYRLQNVCPMHLEKAIQMVVSRHQPLRTLIHNHRGKPKLSEIRRQQHLLQRIDLRKLNPNASFLKDFLAQEQKRPFALHREPGFRAAWLDIGEGEAILLLHFHHIAVDAWGLRLFRRELAQCYASLFYNTRLNIPQLQASYADYAYSQRQYLRGAQATRLKRFWQKKLREVPSLELPTDYPRPTTPSHQGGEVPLNFSRALTQKLQLFARQNQATVFMVLLAGFRGLLQKLSDQRDFCIGTPVANRNVPEWEPLVGAFVNTLAVRISSEANPSFQQLLQKTRRETIAALDHQDLSFAQVVDKVNPPRDLSRHPLFQVMFVFFNTPNPKAASAKRSQQQLFGNPFKTNKPTTLFDVTLYLGIEKGKLQGRLTFSTDLFKQTRAEEFCTYLARLLHQVVDNPQLRLADLDLLPTKTQRQLQKFWNRNGPSPKPPYLPQRITNQFNRQKDRIALVANQVHLSKQFLDEQVQALAARLQKLGIAPEVPVVIVMRRSAARVVAQLAVLRAGGAMVPIHPDQPQQRLHQRMSLAKPKVVLCDPDLKAELTEASFRCKAIHSKPQEHSPNEFEKPQITGQNAAYLSFTSGSTGTPKLTVNHHAGLLNRLLKTDTYVVTTQRTVVLHKTPFEFDVSVWELLWPLLRGLRLELAPEGSHRDPKSLTQWIAKRQITHIHFVPSVLSVFLETAKAADLGSISEVFTSGEALPQQLCQQLRALTSCQLHNLYGPTEAAIEVTHARVEMDPPEKPHLGRPLGGNTIAILDSHGLPATIGQPGSLFLGGHQVARGYYNNPRLTAQCFLPNAFAKKPGGRCYASGDRGRFDQHGNIHFLGRTDQQVKLRGVRLELGEIESVLEKQVWVRRAKVLHKGSGVNACVVAFVVLKEHAPADISRWLNQRLQKVLPHHLCPNQIHILPKLPKTSHGKVDTKQLMETAVSVTPATREIPESHAWLWRLWQSLLGKAPQHSDQSFFDLGGNSLLMVRLAHGIEKQTGWYPSLPSLFRANTLNQQISLLENHTNLEPNTVVFQKRQEPGTWLFVPPATGSVQPYRQLAQAIPNAGSCIGLQCHFSQRNALTIPQMAQQLLVTIQNLSLKPPFRVVGWSSGGTLAFELARQLNEITGVERLVLIDARRFDQYPLKQGKNRLLPFLKAMIPLPTDTLERYLGSETTPKEEQPDFSALLDQLSSSGEADLLPSKKDLTQLFQQEQQMLLACAAYRPSKLEVPVVQIHAEKNRSVNAWSKLCGAGTIEFECRADHFEMLQDPWIDQIVPWLLSSSN